MLRGRELLTGNLYSHDSWDQYWEGTLKRTNGNIGRITTDTNVWTTNYGLADRLNVIAMVPYVWTSASQGVLHGIQGFQDLTLAAKWNFLDKPWTTYGSLRAFLVVSGGLPMTDYNPELLPLSIGMRQHARLVARNAELPIQSRMVSDRHDRIHVALEGRARPSRTSSPTTSSS